MSGRREQVARVIRRKLQQQRAPLIIVFPAWVWKDGEPLVTWSLDHREPTGDEVAAAIVNAGYPENKARAAAATILANRNKTKPTTGSLSEEGAKETDQPIGSVWPAHPPHP
jgi:hypothetical protein